MQLIENIRLAFSSLLANKMRALLTMLGIIIGISAVIMITTIGNSIQKTLNNTFNSIGMTNYFDVYLYTTDEDTRITKDDLISREMLDELLEKYPNYFKLSVNQNFGNATCQNSKGETVTISLTGQMDTTPMQDHLRGRTIEYKDNQQKKNALYVSDLFIRQYFKNGEDPLGQTVNLTLESGISTDFVIVGYDKLPSYYDRMFAPGTKEMDKVSPVAVPIDTLLELTHTQQNDSYYTSLEWNKEEDPEMMEQVLRDFFDEKYAEKKGIGIEIQNEQTQVGMINTVINVITIAISVIAAISLIVGGVGVMNIMLVSITERTKEIGIRKALGAQNSAIRMQFVIESILICLIGGIIGIILGITGGVLIGIIAKALAEQFAPEYVELIIITIEPSIPAILIAVAFSILTGVFFGYYPANKAAKMNPIDALRYD
ncbi:MAG: FtsX-like permease family protein [Oscillospiraceae bacterium]